MAIKELLPCFDRQNAIILDVDTILEKMYNLKAFTPKLLRFFFVI